MSIRDQYAKRESVTPSQRMYNVLEGINAGLQGRAPSFVSLEDDDNMSFVEKELAKRQIEQQFEGTPEEKARRKAEADAQAMMREMEAKTQYARQLREQADAQLAQSQPQTYAPQSIPMVSNMPTTQTGIEPQANLDIPTTVKPAMYEEPIMIQKPSVPVYDPKTGSYVKKFGEYTENPNYLDPIKKAKLEKSQAEILESKNRERNKAISEIQNINRQLDAVERTKGYKDFFGGMGEMPTTLFGLPNPLVPSTIIPGGKTRGQRADWEANIEMLTSQKVIDKMKEMKEQSRTGATGYGQLNEKELDQLISASTRLRKSLTPEDAVRYLNEIRDVYLSARERINKKLNKDLNNKGYSESRQVDSEIQEALDAGVPIQFIEAMNYGQ